MKGFANIMSYANVMEFNNFTSKLMLEENVKNEFLGH